jgi:hypothetical protein
VTSEAPPNTAVLVRRAPAGAESLLDFCAQTTSIPAFDSLEDLGRKIGVPPPR